MSNATERHRAWTAVMHDIATKHAGKRAEEFINSLNEFAAMPPDRRPVVSPSGVVIAEMVALISILRAQIVTFKEQAISAKESELVEYLSRTERQAEIAALAIKSIDIF